VQPNKKFASRSIWTLLLTIILAFSLSSSAFAKSNFDDDDDFDDEHKSKIETLYKRGVIKGDGKKHFAPYNKLTYAEGVQLIVKGLDLNIDHIRFIKEPQGSDYFDKVGDNDWFENAFIIASLNGLSIPRNVEPNKTIDRQTFTNLLAEGLWTKGDFAFTEIWINIDDAKNINANYMNNIQKMLIAKIAKLDKKQKFNPKEPINRLDSAVMIYEAQNFLEKNKPQNPVVDKTVSYSLTSVAWDVNKLTLTWGSKPNPGYRITIERIDFTQPGKAIVYYKLHEPDPGTYYPQVLTEARAETYISASLTPEIKRVTR